MKDKEIDRLRMLLRKVELNAPPNLFTDEVLREITCLEEERVPVDDRLRNVLRRGSLPEPPGNFAYQVQRGVTRPKHQATKPIIARGVWITVGVFLTTCVALALGYPSQDAGSGSFLYFAWLADVLIGWTSTFREPLLYFEAIVLSAGSLLGLEKIVRKGVGWRHT